MVSRGSAGEYLADERGMLCNSWPASNKNYAKCKLTHFVELNPIASCIILIYFLEIEIVLDTAFCFLILTQVLIEHIF